MPEDIIKAKIVFDTGALGRVAGGRAGGVGGVLGTAAGRGGAGGLLGAGAVAGAVAAGVTALIGIVKKGFEAVKRASPRLQATFSIFGKAIMLILRPIGDIMSMFLRPMAIWLIRFARRWLGVFKKKPELPEGEALARGVVSLNVEEIERGREAIDNVNIASGKLNNTLIVLFDIWKILEGVLLTIWGIIKGVAGAIILLGKGFLWLLENVLEPIRPAIDYIADGFVAFGTFISEIGTSIWDLATGGSWEAFLESINVAWSNYYTTWEKSWAIFSEKMFKKLEEHWIKMKEGASVVWETIRKFFVEQMPDFIRSGFDRVRDFFTKTIPDWITGMVDRVNSIISSIMFWRSEKQHGGFINPDTPTLVGERGPELITATKPGFVSPAGTFGGGTTINISVNALDAGSISTGVLNQIASAVANAMKGGLQARTTESIGI